MVLLSDVWKIPGKWKDIAPVPRITLEERAANIQEHDRAGFLRFMRRTLKWAPEDRPTARELLFDEWLMEGLLEFRNRK